MLFLCTLLEEASQWCERLFPPIWNGTSRTFLALLQRLLALIASPMLLLLLL